MESGAGNTFFGSKLKKTKRFLIFDPEKGGVDFRPPPHPQKPKKVGFKWGGGSGGVRTKTHWGMRFLDKKMILQGVKQTIQPLEVGYANSPKKAQKGGGGGVGGVFP